jgi:predicted ester cyclase
MSAEENKAIIRRYCEDFMTEGDLDVADELIHPNCRNPRGSSYWANGPESVKKSVASDREAVPDLRREVKDLVVEGNKVVLYSTVSGTHKGIGGPIPYAPTGEEFTMTGVSTFVIEDGRIVEEPWANWDFGQIFRPIAKAVVRRWIEEVYTGGNLDIVEELIDPNYILHDPFMPGIESIDGV